MREDPGCGPGSDPGMVVQTYFQPPPGTGTERHQNEACADVAAVTAIVARIVIVASVEVLAIVFRPFAERRIWPLPPLLTRASRECSRRVERNAPRGACRR